MRRQGLAGAVVAAVAVMAWAGAVSTRRARRADRASQAGMERPRSHMFYTTSQGSQLLPYSWYLALDQPGGGARRSTPNTLARYGYLENRRDRTRTTCRSDSSRTSSTDRLGLTCAACHTNEIDSGGNTWRIDGAPAEADTWAFLNDLGEVAGRDRRVAGRAKFQRFAPRCAGPTKTPRSHRLYTGSRRSTTGFQVHRLEPHRRAVGPGPHRRVRHDLQPRHRHRPHRWHNTGQAERAGERAVPVGHPLAQLRAVERLGAQRHRAASPRPERG